MICIDQKPVHGHGLMWTHIPHGAEDETGDRPLAERARWLQHAAFFVGLSQRPVLARLGRGLPGGADQRLHPPDQRVRDALPRHQLARLQQLLERPASTASTTRTSSGARATQDTPRQFECTRLITPAQVLGAVERAHAATKEI